MAPKHLPAFTAELPVLTQGRAIYEGVKVEGPFQAYKNDVCLLPNELDEKVPKLHFVAVSVELNVPTQTQTDYAGVMVEGPSKGCVPSWTRFWVSLIC